VGFEPSETSLEISKIMKSLQPCAPSRPLLSPLLAVDLAVSLSLGGLQDRAPKRDGEVCCHEALAGVQIVLPGFVDNPEEAPALCSCIRQCEVNF
jgi:hypothetical protein